MIKFDNFSKFLQYLNKYRNLVEIDIRAVLKADAPYVYFLVYPYRVKLNGEIIIVRYILSNVNVQHFNDAKKVYLMEELPISRFGYSYPEDNYANITVAEIDSNIIVQHITSYGTHGIKIRSRDIPTAVNQIEIINDSE